VVPNAFGGVLEELVFAADMVTGGMPLFDPFGILQARNTWHAFTRLLCELKYDTEHPLHAIVYRSAFDLPNITGMLREFVLEPGMRPGTPGTIENMIELI
jgi:hypothetical protein